MKNFIYILGIAAIALLASCSSKTEEISAELEYKTINPLVKDTIYTSNHVAEINAFQNVKIRSRVGGFIESILVDEGQIVQKGQLLFTINNKQYLQDLLKAKAASKSILAELNASEIELRGAKKLLDKDFISQTEYELAFANTEILRAKLEEAQTEEAQAQLNLSFAQIKAPFDGIINRIPKKIGSLVEEGALLTTISNNQEMFAYFKVSEIDFLKYTMSTDKDVHKNISLILADGSLYPHKGIVETTESEFDRNTGSIAFRAKFPNPENLLKHGATGKVQISNRIENALLIPQKTTFDRQEHICVFVVDENNIIQVRKITPLLRLPHLYAIASGLSPKDKILYEGIQHVREGEKIKAEMLSFSEIIKQ